MPRVEISGVGIVNFPDTMPRDEIMSRAEAMRDQAKQPLLDPRELGTGQLISGGFSRGLEGLKGTALDLIPALGGSIFGQDKYAKEQLAEYKDRMAAAEAENPTAYKSYKEIQSPGDLFGFAAETFGELGPDMLSFIGGAGVGAQVGKYAARKSAEKAIAGRAAELVAKNGLTGEAAEKAAETLTSRALSQGVQLNAAQAGSRIGAQFGLTGSSMATNIPDVLQSVYESTGNLEPGIALTIGPIIGMLDTYLPGKLLNQLGDAGKKRLAADLLNRSTVVPTTFKRAFVGETLKTAGGESITEGVQQALQIAASQIAGDKQKFFSPENVDSIITSALKGAIGGTTYGAPGAAMEASRAKQMGQAEIVQREEAARQEAETQRQEQEQKDQQELARQQQATGDLFGQEVPQGPGIPSQTVAERENAADPVGAAISDLVKQYTVSRSEPERQVIEEKLKRIGDSLPSQSHEKQMLLDFLGPLLGYTPGVSSARTQSIDPNAITVDQQGVAKTQQQAEQERLAPQQVEGYQADLFPQELGLAQAQERAQGLPATVDQSLAGPPVAPTEFKTTLDADSLMGTGLKPQSGFFKKLLNKNLSNPEDQAAVRDILVQVRQNPNIADSTKQAVESLALQAFSALTQQTNVVGPRGGITREANYGRVQPRLADQASGTSVSIPEQQISEPTAGVATPEQSGLESVGSTPSDIGAGETVQPDTLTQEEQDATQTEIPVKAPVAEPPVQTAPAEEIANEAPAKPAEIKSTREDDVAYLKFLEDAYEGTTDPTEIKTLNKEINTLKANIKGAKYQTFDTQPTAEEDNKTLKRLDAKRKVAEAKARKAETGAETKKVKEEIAKLDAEYDAFMLEAGPRSEKRIAALTGKARVGTGGAQFTGDVNKLAKDLRAALDKMGLGGIGLRLEKALTTADGTNAQGSYANQVIQIALNAVDAVNTLNHEALHAMREMGLFSPADWNLLTNMAKSTWLKKYDIETRYPNLTKEEQIEEAVAEAFANFQQQSPNAQSILEKVINTLRRIGNFIKGYQYQITEDILGKAASGQLAKDRADVIEKFNAYGDTRVNSEVKYQVAAQREIFTGMDKVIRGIPKLNDTQKAAISEGVKRAGGTAKSVILSVLPMHALGEVADSVFSGNLGTTFNTLINKRGGYENKLNNGIDATVAEAKKAIAARPEQREAFNTVVNTSTMEEVDPTKARSEYLKDPDKLAAYDKLNKQYNKLDKVWKDLYVTMRGGYKQMYEEIKKAIAIRIDETDLDGKTKVLLKADIMSKLAEKGMIEPYFALGREGQNWLASEYVDRDGQKQFTVEAFKSDYARKVRQEQLLKDGATRSDAYNSLDKVDYRRAPTGSFVNSVLNIMETNKVDPKAIDEMMRLFLTTLPETAFARSFQKRKGTAGAMTDTIGVFERKMRNTSYQVANMVYNPQLTNVVDAMEEQAVIAGQSGAGNKTEVEYVDEFRKHLKFVLSPTTNDIGSILTSAAFTYTLGFNLSSALVNMANIPMIVAPYLKGKYAEAGVARAIGDAAKVFTGSGTKAMMEVIGADGKKTQMLVMPSIANYAPDSEMGKRYATLVRIANEQGQLNRSQLYELINGDTRTGVMAKFNAMSGWMFHHGERMNREVTMVATYNLELDRLKKEGVTGEQAEIDAANKAIYTTELTNGGISAAAAPRIAQNPIGKMFFMYKRYGVSMYYMMFKTAKEALKGETPEARKAAFKQLGGIVGMSALMAGAQGIPMFGALSLVYSLFTDDDDDDLDAVTQKALGDFLYKGPVEALTNVAIAGRITLNDLIIRDAPKGTATTFTQQLMQAVGGPVFGVADRIQRGFSKMNEGNITRAMEDLLPSAIANGFKSYRYATEGTKTLRGDPITGEVSLYNAVGQAIGFAPADYTRQLEINSREKGIDKVISQRTSKEKQKYYVAKREGDFEGMQDAKEKLIEIGAKHPGLGISSSTVGKVLKDSVKAQERATKEMIDGARYNKKRLAEIKASLAEYED